MEHEEKEFNPCNNKDLLMNYVHRIRDMIELDEEMIHHIRHMQSEDKMEIIHALNDVIKSLITLLE